jgi:hypothetical protein
MPKLVYLMAFLIFSSCSNVEPYYEKDYYEKVSNIKFPETAKAIESIDNGEFVTTTVFRLDSINLREFIKFYAFDTVETPSTLRLFGDSYLKTNKPDYSKDTNLFYKAGKKGKTFWLYLVDIDSKKLWAEIQYPDMAGN